MRLEPIFLTVEDVLYIHERQLERFGGSAGIRNKAGLEAAVAMSQSGFGQEYLHKTIFEMAAAYAFHIAESQAFVDGNKRTGFVTAVTFLELNGWLIADPEMRLYDAMIAVANREMGKPELAKLLEELATPSSPG